jgi:hypothetical protein
VTLAALPPAFGSGAGTSEPPAYKPSKPFVARSGVLAAAACLFLLGAAEGLSEFWHPGAAITVAADLCYGLTCATLVLWGARRASHTADPARPSGPGTAPRAKLIAPLVILACVLPLALTVFALHGFAVSADEYGYTYLADTLRHGRLWNAPAPAELRDVLQNFYIPDHDGKRLSQYAPGWPAILAVFSAAGLRNAANPLLGAASAALLALALRQRGAGPRTQIALLAVSILAPFTLFTDASLFNHTLAGTCILGIVCLGLRDERQEAAWAQLCLGGAFAVLLATRYEAFALAFGLYMADGFWRRRVAFLRRALWAACGALPLVMLFGWYNWRITGSPFETTLAWGFPGLTLGLHGHGVDGASTPAAAAERTGRFITWWSEFASIALLPVAAAAMLRRARHRDLRWFDAMLPAVMIFFLFYPDGGGFQYGPRYWFIGWITLPLTIAGAFPGDAFWPVWRWRIRPCRFAILQIAAYAGFTLTYAAFAGGQAAARADALRRAGSVPPPALVLMPTTVFRLVPWQERPIPFDARDMTRNGPGGMGAQVLLGRDLGDARTALLCRQVRDRTIWRLALRGTPPRAAMTRACQK